MKNTKLLKGYLILTGLLLIFIGGSTLMFPVQMKSGAGIDIAENISVINDVRATSAVLLFFAMLSFLGAFIEKLSFTSNLVIVLLFLSIGLGRVISIVIDGMPVDGLVKATFLELILGLAGAIIFKVSQKKSIQIARH
ncbi:MAG: DUF4345 domain-containing protein [Bacteroidota bacterium]